MYQKRERQRLNDLFSGLERPELKPTVSLLEVLPEPQVLPSGVTELEKPFLDYPVAVVDAEAEPEPPDSLPLEAQTPDALILDEPESAILTPTPELEVPAAGITELEQPFLDYAVAEPPESFPLEGKSPEVILVGETEPAAWLIPARALETTPNSASSLPAFAKVITSPLNNDPRNSSAPARQLTEVELSLLTWQAVGIGILIGGLVTGIVLALTAHLDIFGKWGRYALAGGEVLFATLGALFNISSRKTKRALWIGAAGWSLIPLFAALVFILLLTMVMFTNFFGV